jgi:hypothetical protein
MFFVNEATTVAAVIFARKSMGCSKRKGSITTTKTNLVRLK